MATKVVQNDEIGKELTQGEWGVVRNDVETIDGTIRGITSEKTTQCILAYMAKEHTEFLSKATTVIDALSPFIRALKQIHLDKTSETMSEFLLASRDKFHKQLGKREAKHGRCPNIIMKCLYNQFMVSAISRYRYWIHNSTINVTLEAPSKDNPIRPEYNKWMKRKAKKE